MKAHTVSLINALVLIALSSWGYFSSETPSVTALIPTIIGVFLLVCNKGVKTENKVIAHIAVVLTLFVLIGLIKPLSGTIARGDMFALGRVVVMLLTTLWALVAFVQSFIAARKSRDQQ